MSEPKKLYQTEFGKHGNCQSACLAMLLGLNVEDVPNWTTLFDNDLDRFLNQGRWLRERGWTLLTLEEESQVIAWPPQFGYYIAGGVSPRGYRHAVIYKDGQLWHDPHPEGGGIADVQDVDLLVPLEPHRIRL